MTPLATDFAHKEVRCCPYGFILLYLTGRDCNGVNGLSSESGVLLSDCRKKVGVLLSTALVINFLKHGRTQQTIIPSKTRIITIAMPIWARIFCHPVSQLKYWSHGSVIPEFLLSSTDSSSNFLMANVTLPLGPVLSGM
ncbi:hypothetical protein FKM82_026125 [Ascaphus truei]